MCWQTAGVPGVSQTNAPLTAQSGKTCRPSHRHCAHGYGWHWPCAWSPGYVAAQGIATVNGTAGVLTSGGCRCRLATGYHARAGGGRRHYDDAADLLHVVHCGRHYGFCFADPCCQPTRCVGSWRSAARGAISIEPMFVIVLLLYVLRISETPTPRVKRRRAHSLSHCYHAQEPTTSALIHDGIACYRTAALA